MPGLLYFMVMMNKDSGFLYIFHLLALFFSCIRRECLYMYSKRRVCASLKRQVFDVLPLNLQAIVAVRGGLGDSVWMVVVVLEKRLTFLLIMLNLSGHNA